MDKWISVSENLPECNIVKEPWPEPVPCLIVYNGHVKEATYTYRADWGPDTDLDGFSLPNVCGRIGKHVTHWMPMPEPPPR